MLQIRNQVPLQSDAVPSPESYRVSFCLERFCRVCPVFSASSPIVILRRFNTTLILSLIVKPIQMGHADTRMVETVYARTRHEGVMKQLEEVEAINSGITAGL